MPIRNIPRIAPDLNGQTRLPVSSINLRVRTSSVDLGVDQSLQGRPNRNDGVVELVERREMSASGRGRDGRGGDAAVAG